MNKIKVTVVFRGTIEVLVPEDIPIEQQRILAQNIALSRIIVSDDNPDAPEDEACQEYQEYFNLDEEKAGKNWDLCDINSITGNWEFDNGNY